VPIFFRHARCEPLSARRIHLPLALRPLLSPQPSPASLAAAAAVSASLPAAHDTDKAARPLWLRNLDLTTTDKARSAQITSHIVDCQRIEK